MYSSLKHSLLLYVLFKLESHVAKIKKKVYFSVPMKHRFLRNFLGDNIIISETHIYFMCHGETLVNFF